MTNELTTSDSKTGAVVSLTPKNLTEAIALANVMAKSNIVPKEMQGKPENVLISIGMGAEVGMNPFQAVQSIMVVNGRPTIWGDGALGLVRASGLLAKIEEKMEGDTAVCVIQRKGESEASYRFSVADATKAKLINKPGPWQDYPKRMLQMRARSWALRDKFADVLRGLGVREEVDDYQKIETETEIKMPEAEPEKQKSGDELPEVHGVTSAAESSEGDSGSGVEVTAGEIEFPGEPPKDHIASGSLANEEKPNENGNYVTPKQIGLLMARAKSAGISEERIDKYINEAFGVTSKSKLTREQFDNVLKRLAQAK